MRQDLVIVQPSCGCGVRWVVYDGCIVERGERNAKKDLGVKGVGGKNQEVQGHNGFEVSTIIQAQLLGLFKT